MDNTAAGAFDALFQPNDTGKDFVETFIATLDKLEADAIKVGETLTSICRTTGISRATPDRWRKEIPKTILLMAEMQGIVVAKRAALAQGIQQHDD